MPDSKLIQGLQILAKYSGDHNVGAEHDIIYVWPTRDPVTPEDLDALGVLGWFQPDIEYKDQSVREAYRQTESWGYYV